MHLNTELETPRSGRQKPKIAKAKCSQIFRAGGAEPDPSAPVINAVAGRSLREFKQCARMAFAPRSPSLVSEAKRIAYDHPLLVSLGGVGGIGGG